MSSKRSKILLSISALLLSSVLCLTLGHFLYLVYRMHVHGDVIENLMARALAMGHITAPVLLLGLAFLASYVVSKIFDTRRKTAH
ncbi:MAG: hypothetical protein DMG35_20175 [Acidobacteria bacterium]|nr:MAG: hypothetical protein AUH86_17880 [Acidobacteria bacterium 13_1_40CM_4_58_4]PYT57501.1 MAG: hypothetical protein DMG35_20175 [Acidobacteriota bacterium]